MNKAKDFQKQIITKIGYDFKIITYNLKKVIFWRTTTLNIKNV